MASMLCCWDAVVMLLDCRLPAYSVLPSQPHPSATPSPAMASPDDLARELASVGELLEAQCAAGLPREDVLVSVFNSWADRLAKCPKLSDKGKLCLTLAIKKGPWDQQQMKDLASVVLAGKGGVGKASPTRRPNQKMMRVENYIPMDVMVKLRDPAKFSRLSRLSLLAGAVRSVGIECPDQPSLYRMVALVAWAESNWEFTQQDVHSSMDKLQLYIKGVPRNNEIPYVEHYPASASLLPDDVRKLAFPGGELPTDLDIPDLDVILSGHKMRGREPKAKHVPDWISGVPDEFKDAVLNVVQNTAQPPSRRAQPSLPSQPSQPALPLGGNPLPIADCLRFTQQKALPQMPSQQQASPTTPAEPPTEPPALPGQQPTATEGTIEELEKELVAAVKGRGKPRAAKRPAAAPKQVLKRPSTAKSATTWKNVHSKIYAAARKAHFAKTGDDSAAKAKASEACAKAKIQYMAGTLKV